MMVEPEKIPAICLRFASPMMISISLGCKVRYAVFSYRGIAAQRTDAMRQNRPKQCLLRWRTV
jgi:hypothetical protein